MQRFIGLWIKFGYDSTWGFLQIYSDILPEHSRTNVFLNTKRKSIDKIVKMYYVRFGFLVFERLFNFNSR